VYALVPSGSTARSAMRCVMFRQRAIVSWMNSSVGLDPVDPLGPVKEANGRTEARIKARAPYALKRKEGPDADGDERLSCPALGDHPASCARCGKARSPLGIDG